jgi:hypothetical protein
MLRRRDLRGVTETTELRHFCRATDHQQHEGTPMNTTDPTFPLGTVDTTQSRVRRRTILAIGAAAAIAIAASAAAVQGSDDDTSRPTAPQPTLSKYEQLRDLANRGVIPRQALLPAPMTDEELRALVDRGVVPRQALDPAPTTTLADG